MARGEQGVTLIEMMMAVAVVGVVGAGSAVAFGLGTKLWVLNKTKVALQLEARTTMQLIHAQLQQAQASTIKVSRQNSSQPPYSKIAFTKVDGTAIQYYQVGDSLYQNVGGKERKLAENLRLLHFSFPRTDDMTIIGISLCLEKTVYEGGTKSLYLTVDKARVLNP